MAIHNIIGQKGEEIAIAYLQENGYRILSRNWRFKRIEIDVVAIKDDLLVVVEVKTRTYHFVENLSEIVTRKKQKSIIIAADAFINNRNLSNEVRFDIIFIVINGESYQLEHIKEAFTAVE
jgi:putative endonuclease